LTLQLADLGRAAMTTPERVAILIDCDNISYRLAGAILAEAAQHGTVSIRRGYGDWSSAQLKGWAAILPQHAIQPIHQPAYTVRKNSTDSAMTVDAMDLLFAGNTDMFYLVSSDSDFTRLAMRLRESGRRVYGIGARNTAASFVNACDRFTFAEILAGNASLMAVKDSDGPGAVGKQTGAPPTPTPGAATQPERHGGKGEPIAVDGGKDGSIEEVPDQPGNEPAGSSALMPVEVPDVKELLVPAIERHMNHDGWAMLSSVGHQIVAETPSVDSRNYGYPKLCFLVRNLDFVEVKDVPDPNGFPQLWVRLLANSGS